MYDGGPQGYSGAGKFLSTSDAAVVTPQRTQPIPHVSADAEMELHFYLV